MFKRSWAQASRISLPRPWQPVRRTNSAADQASVDSHRPNETLASAGTSLLLVKRSGLSVRIRTTRFLESPASAFAVIRAVERKYGALTEYRFSRDFEVGYKYQSIVHAVFRDPQSVDRISADDTLRIPAPHYVPDRPGGIGLDELEGLLELQEHVKEAGVPAFANVMESVLRNGEENDSFIDCRVTRSKQDFFTIGQHSSYYSRRIRDTIARNFINWGGFYDLKPIEKIANEDLSGRSPIDHIRMRRAIRRWSELSHLQNPYEYPKGSVQARREPISTEDPVEWVPLPGCEQSSEDVPVPMPSAIEASQSYPSQSTPSQPEIPDSPMTVPSASSTDSKLTDTNSSSPATLLDDGPLGPLSKPLEKRIFSGVPSDSIRDKKAAAAQLKAARDLVKRIEQPEKKNDPARQMSSPEQESKITRPLARPAKVEQETMATQRLKNFLNGWF